jgi:ergothioneine biosynthesis protein EgtB
MRLPRPELQERQRDVLAGHLSRARSASDGLFRIVRSDALYDRPIPERHRIIFYLGHLEAFDWNLLGRGPYDLPAFNAEFDRLFAFGIDPTNGDIPDDRPQDWPRIGQVEEYNANVRRAIDDCLNSEPLEETVLRFWVAIEHRLMHAETLAYMLHWLPYEKKILMPHLSPSWQGGGRGRSAPDARSVEIPAGEATLGLDPAREFPFGWDNEFAAHRVVTPAFSVDVYPVTNAQYMQFVEAGGYEAREFWSDDAWNWLQSAGIRHPKFWERCGDHWMYRTMFAQVPLPPAWPVYVSHAEAQAYARWKGKSLPTEAQFHRAAYGGPVGRERLYPWGDFRPDASRGNFDLASWTPSNVDAHPRGASAFGIADTVGNGYEWTSTPFEAFPGFEPFPFYPGYSANFFDGKHYVMKGASPRTAAPLIRRSMRNWFQPFYPYIYAKFRCVEN